MMRCILSAILSWLILAPALAAQSGPWQFLWTRGATLNYQVEHTTSASETVGESKSETKTKLNLTKRWVVLDVDAAGAATLQLSLTALRLETISPRGEALVYDSNESDKSNPQLREQLSRYVGSPLVVLRIDGQGRVLEVKECKHGPARRFESEPPFVIVLPPSGPQTGQTWHRTYRITLEPPQGTGDQYPAIQQYACKSVVDNLATVTVTTRLKAMPESLLDRVPLLQMQPEGEVVFDTKAGRLQSAKMYIEKELKENQGPGSSYQFKSLYKEEFHSDK